MPLEESRKIGVCVAILKETSSSDGPDVFVVSDEAKPEEMAVGTTWRDTKQFPKRAWSLPGGGKATVAGYQETLYETAARELKEEVFTHASKTSILQLLARESSGVQQSAPYLAAQIDGKLNLIAATSLALPFDSLDAQSQKSIDRLERHGLAHFISLAELAELYQLVQSGNDYNTPLKHYRPHSLVAAFLWHLHHLGKSEEAVAQLRQKTYDSYQSAVGRAATKGLVVSNGAFSEESGDLLPAAFFSPEDRAFLGLK